LACIGDRVSLAAQQAALFRARAVGVTTERALIASASIDEDAYWKAVADTAGIVFDDLRSLSRRDCPLPDAQLIQLPPPGCYKSCTRRARIM
jgi:hypothetical protein